MKDSLFKKSLNLIVEILCGDNTIDEQDCIDSILCLLDNCKDVYFSEEEFNEDLWPIFNLTEMNNSIIEGWEYISGCPWETGRQRNYVKAIAEAIIKTDRWKNIQDSPGRREVINALEYINSRLAHATSDSVRRATYDILQKEYLEIKYENIQHNYRNGIDMLDGKIIPNTLMFLINLVRYNNDSSFSIHMKSINNIVDKGISLFKITPLAGVLEKNAITRRCNESIIGKLVDLLGEESNGFTNFHMPWGETYDMACTDECYSLRIDDYGLKYNKDTLQYIGSISGDILSK